MRRVQIRFCVVTSWPKDDWHSRRLLACCGRLGPAASVDPAELGISLGVKPFELEVLAPAGRRSCHVFVLARGLGRSGDPDVQFEIYRALEASGAVVINRIDPLLAAQDKFRTSWMLRRAGVPTPTAAVAQTRAGALEALSAMGEAVVKPIAGSLGEGVERACNDKAGRRAVARRLERDGSVYLQAFVPNAGRDLRLFVVGRRLEGAVERLAAPGGWLTNLARGARARPGACSRAAKSAAVRATVALGLDYAGVDVVDGPDGPTVIEVNGNPSWQGVLEATGKDMAEPIAEYALGLVEKRLERQGRSSFHMGASHG